MLEDMTTPSQPSPSPCRQPSPSPCRQPFPSPCRQPQAKPFPVPLARIAVKNLAIAKGIYRRSSLRRLYAAPNRAKLLRESGIASMERAEFDNETESLSTLIDYYVDSSGESPESIYKSTTDSTTDSTIDNASAEHNTPTMDSNNVPELVLNSNSFSNVINGTVPFNSALAERRASRAARFSTTTNGSPLSRKAIENIAKSQADRRGTDSLANKGQKRDPVADSRLAETSAVVTNTEPAQAAVVVTGAENMQDANPTASSEVTPTISSLLTIPESPARSLQMSPIQMDDDVRRLTKYDCGPTVRYSIDCYDVIMGKPAPDTTEGKHQLSIGMGMGGTSKSIASIKSNISSELTHDHAGPSSKKNRTELIISLADHDVDPKAKSENPASSARRPLGSNNLDIKKYARGGDKKTAGNVGDGNASGPFPPRKSSLSPAHNSTYQAAAAKTPTQAEFVNRLARPTNASAAREAASKASIKPSNPIVKKTSATPVVRKSLPFSRSNKTIPATAPRQSLPDSGTLTSVKRASQGLKSRFSNMLGNRRTVNESSVKVATDKPLPLLSDKAVTHLPSVGTLPTRSASRDLETKKPSKDLGDLSQPAEKVTVFEASNTSSPSRESAEVQAKQATIARSAVGRLITLRPENPTPPSSSNGPATLPQYPTLALFSTQENGDVVDELLRAAEEHLRIIIQSAGNMSEGNEKQALIKIIELLGKSIQNTREVRMMLLVQATANSELASAVQSFGAEVAAGLL